MCGWSGASDRECLDVAEHIDGAIGGLKCIEPALPGLFNVGSSFASQLRFAGHDRQSHFLGFAVAGGCLKIHATLCESNIIFSAKHI